MRKTVWSVTLFLFFIWILPLGAFIKPAQEKTACNGRRAICLCSHLVAKQQAKSSGKVYYSAASSVQEKEHSSPSASHHFLLAQNNNQDNPHFASYLQQQSLLYSFDVLRFIEHVPKA